MSPITAVAPKQKINNNTSWARIQTKSTENNFYFFAFVREQRLLFVIMVFHILSSIAMAMLVLSNVHSTCTTLLKNGDTERILRTELQFWVAFVLVNVVTGLFRDDKPELEVVTSIALVLLKHFDHDQAILARFFNFSESLMKAADEHFISPNTQRLLVRPCTTLLHYTLSTMQHSQHISKDDKHRAVKSIQENTQFIRTEIRARDKERLAASLSPAEQKENVAEHRGVGGVALQTPVKRTPVPVVTFSSLRNYYSKHGMAMTDERIQHMLKVYDGKLDVLRRKLVERYGFDFEEPRPVHTPKSAGTLGRGRPNSTGIHKDGPATTGPTLRHRTSQRLPTL